MSKTKDKGKAKQFSPAQLKAQRAGAARFRAMARAAIGSLKRSSTPTSSPKAAKEVSTVANGKGNKPNKGGRVARAAAKLTNIKYRVTNGLSNHSGIIPFVPKGTASVIADGAAGATVGVIASNLIAPRVLAKIMPTNTSAVVTAIAKIGFAGLLGLAALMFGGKRMRIAGASIIAGGIAETLGGIARNAVFEREAKAAATQGGVQGYFAPTGGGVQNGFLQGLANRSYLKVV